jgi:nucleoside-diphosphate-sugar epimerase
VDDLVLGIDAVMQNPTIPETPINLGNVNEFTMLELANLVLHRIAWVLLSFQCHYMLDKRAWFVAVPQLET